MAALGTDEQATRRLLVVDDETIARMIIARSAAPLGYVADTAANLDEAAALLERNQYDAIVLDLSIGEHEGISLLPSLRNTVADPVVIFVSGMDARIRAASARLASTLGLRVAGALPKPIVPSALRALLRITPAPNRPDGKAARDPPTVEALRAALDAGSIMASFQPKVTLRGGAVMGAEALARWHLAGGGVLSPDLFIPLAEASGLIVPLTFAVMQQSLADCSAWQRRFPGCGVAVNISPLVLANPELPDQIEAMLHDAGLAPGAVIAEITESVIIADPVLAAEVVTRLRIKGIGLAIDDFGTGHSSLLSLMRLPFTELKIDRSFVADCETDPEAWKIVRATVSLAHELGLSVVAEGVETESIARRLTELGCDIGQGWYFARSMPAEALERWLGDRATS